MRKLALLKLVQEYRLFQVLGGVSVITIAIGLSVLDIVAGDAIAAYSVIEYVTRLLEVLSQWLWFIKDIILGLRAFAIGLGLLAVVLMAYNVFPPPKQYKIPKTVWCMIAASAYMLCTVANWYTNIIDAVTRGAIDIFRASVGQVLKLWIVVFGTLVNIIAAVVTGVMHIPLLPLLLLVMFVLNLSLIHI